MQAGSKQQQLQQQSAAAVCSSRISHLYECLQSRAMHCCSVPVLPSSRCERLRAANRGGGWMPSGDDRVASSTGGSHTIRRAHSGLEHARRPRWCTDRAHVLALAGGSAGSASAAGAARLHRRKDPPRQLRSLRGQARCGCRLLCAAGRAARVVAASCSSPVAGVRSIDARAQAALQVCLRGGRDVDMHARAIDVHKSLDVFRGTKRLRQDMCSVRHSH